MVHDTNLLSCRISAVTIPTSYYLPICLTKSFFRASHQTNHLYAGPGEGEGTIKNTFLEKYQMNSSGVRGANVEIFLQPILPLQLWSDN